MKFKFNDKSVRAIGRWGVDSDSYVTTATGSKLEIAFKGKLITLHFDMCDNQSPYPHLWISVDNKNRFEATLDHYIRVWCEDDGEHLLTVVYKGGQEITPRWYKPLVGKVQFCGYEAKDCACLPETKSKTIEFVGDSITEGVLIDAQYMPFSENGPLNRPFQDDVLATYAAITAENLKMEAYFAGYGAVGVTKSGCGEVPAAAQMYPFCFDGCRVSYPPCDYIVINHGTNDRRNPDEFEQKYYELLSVIYNRNPESKIIAMVPFIGAFRNEIHETVKKFNKQNNTDIFVVDTDGWVPSEPLHPLRESHFKAAQKLTAVLKEKYFL